MQLVYDDSNNAPVNIGDPVIVKGTPYYVMSIIKPHKPSSTGRVLCKAMTEEAWICEWYPSVIGARWIEREDQ